MYYVHVPSTPLAEYNFVLSTCTNKKLKIQKERNLAMIVGPLIRSRQTGAQLYFSGMFEEACINKWNEMPLTFWFQLKRMGYGTTDFSTSEATELSDRYICNSSASVLSGLESSIYQSWQSFSRSQGTTLRLGTPSFFSYSQFPLTLWLQSVKYSLQTQGNWWVFGSCLTERLEGL